MINIRFIISIFLLIAGINQSSAEISTDSLPDTTGHIEGDIATYIQNNCKQANQSVKTMKKLHMKYAETNYKCGTKFLIATFTCLKDDKSCDEKLLKAPLVLDLEKSEEFMVIAQKQVDEMHRKYPDAHPIIASADFIHPMDFDGSESQRSRVIEIIKNRVRHDYCEGTVDMCQPTTLRMMEDENLKSFKLATKAQDRQIMNRVIQDYCGGTVDMCNYSTIWMMYQENLKSSRKSLEW